jgi:hypothetical protein
MLPDIAPLSDVLEQETPWFVRKSHECRDGIRCANKLSKQKASLVGGWLSGRIDVIDQKET